MKRMLATTATIGLAVAIGAAGLSFGDAQRARQSQADAEREADRDLIVRGLGEMISAGLAESPGCLGVDGGTLNSGKSVVIAWFENKKALETWFHSDAHTRMMNAFSTFGDETHGQAFMALPDDKPIMVVTSFVFTDSTPAKGMNLPISEMSIEMYAPLPGGAYINGRFSPRDFPMPSMTSWGSDS